MSFRDIDRGLIGEEYDFKEYPPIQADELVRYAKSLGVEDPLYTDQAAAAEGPWGGLVAFPTYVVKLRGAIFLPPAVRDKMNAQSFDAGKDIDFDPAEFDLIRAQAALRRSLMRQAAGRRNRR